MGYISVKLTEIQIPKPFKIYIKNGASPYPLSGTTIAEGWTDYGTAVGTPVYPYTTTSIILHYSGYTFEYGQTYWIKLSQFTNPSVFIIKNIKINDEIAYRGIIPSVTPSATPGQSITPTPTLTRTPTRTPSRTIPVSPSKTPTITPSISFSATLSVTPTRTPTRTVSQTVSITPSISESMPSEYYYYAVNEYGCDPGTGNCSGSSTEQIIRNTYYIVVESPARFYSTYISESYSVIHEVISYLGTSPPGEIAYNTDYYGYGSANCEDACMIV